ncbi:TraB/GumN family protein [Qipengyuania gelatinilytica]|uniref:TraB/GumN family protein n=1 Tax=Qipengyuania gelatinilytica TaxID=2867231 RepID=A0ABX9A2J4_9SPHN|nr:TraB/GumN family protein [Qipengyuania gelatinilytica]QZD95485.1 TraB/GumN family protein [Qipengyuania gelatinilytica]
MTARFLFPFLAAFLLASCDSPDEPSAVSLAQGYPALWQVENADGETEAWLYGTIHALPADVAWRSAEFEKVAGQADFLVVEAAGLDDTAGLAALFGRISADEPPQQGLVARLDPALRDTFKEFADEKDLSVAALDGLESWAAALAIARAASTGDTRNGIDRILIDEFADEPIGELEGPERQLAIFDDLPEAEQRDLLNAVVEEATLGDEGVQALAVAWKSGDLDTLEARSRQGMLSDPELREALLVERNRYWAAQLDMLLAQEKRPLIAVGAAHLVGPDGLPAFLEARGYVVRRIQ